MQINSNNPNFDSGPNIGGWSHENVWPEIEASIINSGIESLEFYLISNQFL